MRQSHVPPVWVSSAGLGDANIRSVDRTVSPRRRPALVGAAALMVADAGLAWRSDAVALQARAWLTTLDMAVGLAFIAAAAGARGDCAGLLAGCPSSLRSPWDWVCSGRRQWPRSWAWSPCSGSVTAGAVRVPAGSWGSRRPARPWFWAPNGGGPWCSPRRSIRCRRNLLGRAPRTGANAASSSGWNWTPLAQLRDQPALHPEQGPAKLGAHSAGYLVSHRDEDHKSSCRWSRPDPRLKTTHSYVFWTAVLSAASPRRSPDSPTTLTCRDGAATSPRRDHQP